LAELLELGVDRGVLIVDVTRGQAADEAGLRGGQRNVRVGDFIVPVGGDILIAIDGSPLRDMGDLVQYLETETRVGQRVELTVVRDGQERTVAVTLGEQPRS
jgi:S1-C subfamily serine protease